MGAALLSGKIDYARALDPVTAKKVQATPGMSSTAFYQSVIQAVWLNNAKKPFNDPRVRRALHLALNRPTLVDVVKDVAPMMVGGFLYPFSEFATLQTRWPSGRAIRPIPLLPSKRRANFSLLLATRRV